MSDATDRSTRELPIFCNLSEQELANRRQRIVTEIFKSVQQVQEMEDGY